MDAAEWLRTLAAEPWLTPLGGALVFVLGTLFGSALPWWTTNRKVAHDIAIDKLKQLEDSLDRDTRRTASLMRGFEDEPAPPSDEALEGIDPNDVSLVRYQRTRYKTAQELPVILAELAATREELISTRKRVLGNPKSKVKPTLDRLQVHAADIDRRLNEVLERLAAQPRVFVTQDQPTGAQDGDIWLSY